MKTLIVIVTIIGLAAVAGSIIVGVKSFVGLVTQDPYEKGLLWDEIRNKEDALGWHVDIQNREFVTGDNDVLISVLDKYGGGLAGSRTTVMISRPATTEYDKYIDTVKVKEGIFRAKVNFPLYGYWDIDMDVSNEEDKLLFKKRIFVNKGGMALINDKADCMINSGTCIREIEQEGIKVSFDIYPKPVSPMKDLVFSVTVTEKGSPVTDALVIVDLTMPGMFMGTNRPSLIQTADGKYEGKGIIQACSHGGKTWRAEVKITRHNKTYFKSFIFEVE